MDIARSGVSIASEEARLADEYYVPPEEIEQIKKIMSDYADLWQGLAKY